MLWFVSQSGQRSVTTRRGSGESVDAAFERHAEAVDALVQRLAEGPGRTEDRLYRPAGADDAQESSYFDRGGILHGVLVLHRTREEIAELEACRDAALAVAKELALDGKYDEAAREIAAIGEKAAVAKGRVMREAMTALLARFPQWTRWHAEDEARGIIRSDAEREPVHGC